MATIPTGSARRMIKALSVPVAAGGRMAAAGTKTFLGFDAEEATAKARAATARQLFLTLGQMKGGAMKLGQALSVLEPALPAEMMDPYREAIRALQEQAPPVPWAQMKPSAAGLPHGVRVHPTPSASASLGQVHRGRWLDGRPVAVKLQYPDVARAVRSDAAQLRIMAPVFGRLVPGIDVRGLVDAHVGGLLAELDYQSEAENQEEFRLAWQGTDVRVPAVLWVSPTCLVTEWVDATGFGDLIGHKHDQHRKDRAGELLLRFTLDNPQRLGRVHADPHPGNFRLDPDGRLVVLDFGAVGNPAGFTQLFADTTFAVDAGRFADVARWWIADGWIAPGTTPEMMADLMAPDPAVLDPAGFQFSREWMGRQASRWWSPAEVLEAGRRVRMPPSALLEHRALMGAFAVCCQLEAHVPFRDLVDRVRTERGRAAVPGG